MPHAAFLRISSSSRLLGACAALLLGLALGNAHADEYEDVNALLRQGRSAEALSKADAYITEKPRDPQMRFLRGVIQTNQGHQADAIATFTQLAQDFPELPEPYNNLAALYASQSKFDQARTALETAIRLNPGYATAHENLGDVYVRLAAQSYGRVQQIEKGNTTVAPKLALLREVFMPKPAPKPASTTPSTTSTVPGASVKDEPSPK